MNELSPSLPRAASGGPFWALLTRGMQSHGLFFIVAILYLYTLALSLMLFPSPGGSVIEVLAGVVTGAVPIALLAIVLRELYAMVRTERPVSPTKRLWQRVVSVIKDQRRLAAGLPMFLAFALFMFVFTTFKGQITVMAPFAWDPAFDHWDRALHFGWRPWELLQPLLSSGFSVFLLNLNYNCWFMVMNLFLVHFAFYVPPCEKRTHFFLTFFALWMFGGTLLATFLSSAGPCYFDDLGLGTAAYGPLMARLVYINEYWPVWALATQDMLWSFKQQQSALGGVSAMPSMHNATALLFVFAIWPIGGWMRRLVAAHCIFIFLGSVILGWHYAVDGYAAFALTAASWLALKPVARWWHARPQVLAFDREIAVRGVP